MLQRHREWTFSLPIRKRIRHFPLGDFGYPVRNTGSANFKRNPPGNWKGSLSENHGKVPFTARTCIRAFISASCWDIIIKGVCGQFEDWIWTTSCTLHQSHVMRHPELAVFCTEHSIPSSELEGIHYCLSKGRHLCTKQLHEYTHVLFHYKRQIFNLKYIYSPNVYIKM